MKGKLQKHWKWLLVLIVLLGALLLAMAMGAEINNASAQPVTGGGSDPLHEIAPGQVVWSGAITCDNTATVFFQYDHDGTPSSDENMLFPDGSRVLLKNQTASTVARCAFVADETSDTIGDQSTIATYDEIGGTQAGLDDIIGGETVPLVFAYSAWPAAYPGRDTGVCDEASTHDVSDQYNVHKMCAATADCASIAGMTGGADCDTTTQGTTLGSFGRRGALLACRCSAAATLTARIVR